MLAPGVLKLFRAATISAVLLEERAFDRSARRRHDAVVERHVGHWLALFDEHIGGDVHWLSKNFQSSQEFCTWASSVLLDNMAHLSRFIAGGLYGSVFSATLPGGGNCAVKFLTFSPDEYVPPKYEVKLAKRFARMGLGVPVIGDLHGFKTSTNEELRRTVKSLVRGPKHANHGQLSHVLGFYFMEQILGTLKDFLARDNDDSTDVFTKLRLGNLAEERRMLHDALLGLLQGMQRAGHVHGDLHENNVAYQQITPFAAEAAAAGGGGAPPPHHWKFFLLDFGRSFGRQDLEHAWANRRPKPFEGRISDDDLLRIGSAVDGLYMERTLLEAAKRFKDVDVIPPAQMLLKVAYDLHVEHTRPLLRRLKDSCRTVAEDYPYLQNLLEAEEIEVIGGRGFGYMTIEEIRENASLDELIRQRTNSYHVLFEILNAVYGGSIPPETPFFASVLAGPPVAPPAWPPAWPPVAPPAWPPAWPPIAPPPPAPPVRRMSAASLQRMFGGSAPPRHTAPGVDDRSSPPPPRIPLTPRHFSTLPARSAAARRDDDDALPWGAAAAASGVRRSSSSSSSSSSDDDDYDDLTLLQG